VYEYMLTGEDIPMVPVMINTFFPPNQPTPARCYALGRSLRKAIDSWDSDKRVAVIASGGLSHTIMDEEIDRMTRIVDELLFLSRADMGEVKMDRLPVKLESLLEDIHRQASLLGHERNVQVALGLVMPAVVLGDELRLRELLLNLVDNAVKYSRPGGSVDISLTTQPSQAKVVIADQGIGISKEDQKRIFDRFYRTDDARSHTKKGTGLGLAICAWIVESHHGRIEVQSEPNKGSTFTVLLPLTPAA